MKKTFSKICEYYKNLCFYVLHHENLICWMCFAFAALLCMYQAAINYRLNSSSYMLFDGSFQTYNGISRMFSGEIPFKDFYYYLGLGPLYTLILFVFPWRTDYVPILTAIAGFCPFVAFLSCFAFSFMATRKKNLAALIALIFWCICFFNLKFQLFVFPGISLRPFRFLIIPLISSVFFWRSRKSGNIWLSDLWLGMLAGLSLTWSSDFGICGAIACYCYVITKSSWKLLLPRLLLTVLVSCGCAYGIVSVLTSGNFGEWLSYLFINVPQDQNWLFINNYYPFEISSLFNFLRIREFWIGVLIVFAFFLVNTPVFAKLPLPPRVRGFLDGQKIFFIPFLAIFGAACGYCLFNTPELFPFLWIVSLIWLFSVAANGYFYSSKRGKRIYFYARPLIAISVIVGGVAVLTAAAVTVKRQHRQQRTYFKGIGKTRGMLRRVARKAAKFPPDAKIWEYYSAAISCTHQTKNPSGIDYIIHVLGPKYREKYVQDFLRYNPDYVTIPDPSCYFSFWAVNMFWRFSREVLSRYDYVDIGFKEYSVFKRAKSLRQYPQYEIEKKIRHIDDKTIEIMIHSTGKDHLVECGLSYEVDTLPLAVNPHIYIFLDNPWQNRCLTSISAPGKADHFLFAAIVDQYGNGRILLQTRQRKIRLKEITFGKCYSSIPWSLPPKYWSEEDDQ